MIVPFTKKCFKWITVDPVSQSATWVYEVCGNELRSYYTPRILYAISCCL